LKEGLKAGLQGAICGGIYGGIVGGAIAKSDGKRFWDGATVEYECIFEGDMPAVGQNAPYNCLPGCAESFEKKFGGNLTQDDFRKMMGGNPNEDGVKDTDFWKEVFNLYAEHDQFELKKGSFILMESNLKKGCGVAVTLDGGYGDHSIIVSGIYNKKISRCNGFVKTKRCYNVMDTAGGGGYAMVTKRYLKNRNSFYLKGRKF